MRLYRENIALKAQHDALERRLFLVEGKPKRPLGLRAAQLFAYLLTRGDEPFRRYSLSARERPSCAGPSAFGRCGGVCSLAVARR
jgi:hypothetical protein